MATFHGDESLRANMRKSFERILSFLGLAQSQDGKVVEGPNFAERARDVWAYPNHNWLRITRILRSLKLLGLEKESRALLERRADFHRTNRYPIGADTFRYWTAAVEGTPLRH
jgi:hypothetical protein